MKFLYLARSSIASPLPLPRVKRYTESRGIYTRSSSNLCTRGRRHGRPYVLPFPWLLSSRQMKRSRIGSIYSPPLPTPSRPTTLFKIHRPRGPCAVAPLNVAHLPEGFIGNRYRARVECSFQRYDRRRAGHAWTGWRKTERTTTNDDDQKQTPSLPLLKRKKKRKSEREEKEERERERERNEEMGKNGKINCHKVWSITRPAPDRA